MDRQTISQMAPALVPVAEVVTKYYMTERQIEQQRDAELELIEARNRHDTSDGPEPETLETLVSEADTSSSSDSSAAVESSGGDHLDSTIDELRTATDCKVCEKLLEGMHELSPGDKTRALMEYSRFQGQIEDGDLEEVKAVLRDAPRLQKVLTDVFGAPAPEPRQD
jgi:hypothetical protein